MTEKHSLEDWEMMLQKLVRALEMIHEKVNDSPYLKSILHDLS